MVNALVKSRVGLTDYLAYLRPIAHREDMRLRAYFAQRRTESWHGIGRSALARIEAGDDVKRAQDLMVSRGGAPGFFDVAPIRTAVDRAYFE
jgi:hypothetical protein